MSRLIQGLLKSTQQKTKLDNIVVFLNPQVIDLDILNINTKLIVFDKHKLDINNRLTVIGIETVNNSLGFLPDAIICADITNYPNSKNLSTIFRLPHINIIKELPSIKREVRLDLARGHWLGDINLVKSKEIAEQLYITNYSILESNLEQQIIREINNWIPA